MLESRIIPGMRYHCGQIARRMRLAQRSTIVAAGLDPHRQVRVLFNASGLCRAWLLDGRLMALGGITGGLLAENAFIWLILADESRHHPAAVLREGRRQLVEIMRLRREVATTISIDDEDAIRFAAHLGFHVAHEGAGSPATCRLERRALAAEVRDNPALRIPVGDARLVAMGYHPADNVLCA